MSSPDQYERMRPDTLRQGHDRSSLPRMSSNPNLVGGWGNQPDDCGNGTYGTDYHHHQDNGGQIMYFYDDRNTD